MDINNFNILIKCLYNIDLTKYNLRFSIIFFFSNKTIVIIITVPITNFHRQSTRVQTITITFKSNIYIDFFKIGLSPSEEVVSLKLIDVGVPKDNIMIIQTGMYVVQIIIPVIAVKYTAGPKPMSIYLNIIPFKYEK